METAQDIVKMMLVQIVDFDCVVGVKKRSPRLRGTPRVRVDYWNTKHLKTETCAVAVIVQRREKHGAWEGRAECRCLFSTVRCCACSLGKSRAEIST